MPNNWQVIVPQVLARGLKTLRENLVMARISLRKYDYAPGTKGSTVEIPVPQALVTNPVAPGPTSVQAQDSTPTQINIPVDQWEEAPFYITDKEMVEARADAIMMQADEAVKALANKIDSYLWGLAVAQLNTGAFSHGTGGVTPFKPKADGLDDIEVALRARARLDDALAPNDNRYVVFNPDAEANLMQQRRFADASYAGGDSTQVRGMMLGDRFGLNWVKTQMAPRETSSDITGFQMAAVGAVGATQISVDKGAGNFQNTPKVGTLFTVAGSTTQHVVTSKTANKAAANNTAVTLNIAPALTAQAADNAVLTAVSYVSNLVMHRDFLAFVTKPLMDDEMMKMHRQAGNGYVESFTDPVSGVTLRATLVRQHYQWRFAFDALWGGKVIRTAFGRRIFG